MNSGSQDVMPPTDSKFRSPSRWPSWKIHVITP